MALPPGARIGPYEVTALLGEGGMGQVYRARDTKLDRDIALKILPESFATDRDRLMRFEREAKTLASLNHPHIAQIYGLEENALVMELVEGEDLSERIARGPIPLDEALPIARQIAEALEAAHDQGIIHRDLKPANIKVRIDGTVKVLDFGLAKAMAPDDPAVTSLHQTVTSPAMTMHGVILGTAAYMSPEQARGKAVDKRADIWALGVTLFEMLSGQILFGDETTSDTLAAVLRKPIEWSRLPADVPSDVRHLLRLCLERDPARRLRDAGDAGLLLDAAAAAAPAAVVTSAPAAHWIRWALVAVIASLAGGLGAWTLAGRPAAPPSTTVRFAITPPGAVGAISNVALSADGSVLAYLGDHDAGSGIYLYRFDGGESQALPGTSGAQWPFVSPNGKWVGFFRDGKLQKIAVNGGGAITLCDAIGGPGAVWLPDRRVVFAVGWTSGLSVVSEDGGTPAALTTVDGAAGETGHWWPAIGPDGGVLFTLNLGSGVEQNRIARVDLKTGTRRTLFAGARAYWLASGHLLFYRAGRYHVAALDPSGDRLAGDPLPVFPEATGLSPEGDLPQHLAASPSGTVALVPGKVAPDSKLAWISRTGTVTPLGLPARSYLDLAVSPDGHRAALGTIEDGRFRLRIADLERATDTLLDTPGLSWRGIWHPDNRRLAFLSMRRANFDVYVKDLSSGEPEQPFIDDEYDTGPLQWTADGGLIFYGANPDSTFSLKLRDAREPSRIHALTGPEEPVPAASASLSPDNKWLAFNARREGGVGIRVQRFPGPGPEFKPLRGGGVDPVFSPIGRSLYFVRGTSLVETPWREVEGRFVTGDERVVSDAIWHNSTTANGFGITPDGRILSLILAAPLEPPRIKVMLGWSGELSAALPR